MSGCGDQWCDQAWDFLTMYILIGMGILGMKSFGAAAEQTGDSWA